MGRRRKPPGEKVIFRKRPHLPLIPPTHINITALMELLGYQGAHSAKHKDNRFRTVMKGIPIDEFLDPRYRSVRAVDKRWAVLIAMRWMNELWQKEYALDAKDRHCPRPSSPWSQDLKALEALSKDEVQTWFDSNCGMLIESPSLPTTPTNKKS